MEKELTEALGRSALAAGCSRADLDRLSALGRRERFAAGDVVGSPGDLWLRALRSGVLGLVVTPPSGRPVMVELLEPGDLFGAMLCAAAWLDEELDLSIQALTDAEVFALPQNAVQRHLRGAPRVLESLLGEQRRRFSRLVATAAQGGDRIDLRLLRLLLRLSRVLGPEVPLTRRVLAMAAGTTTETVIRTLAPLERAACISSRRGVIQLLQPLKLRERLEQLKARARGDDGTRRRRRR